MRKFVLCTLIFVLCMTFINCEDVATLFHGQKPGEIIASRDHIGMMEIIGHIGSESGIDDGIYCNTDVGAAQKIISIAR